MESNILVVEHAMQLLGSLAFGVMTVVNLIVLGLVVKGLVQPERSHR